MTDTDRATVDGLEALMSSPPKVCRHGNTIDRANGIDCLHCIWARVEPSNMERSNFEHWARAERLPIERAGRFDTEMGAYVDQRTAYAWMAWSARAKLANR